MTQRLRRVRWPLAVALVGVCCSLVLPSDTAHSEHTEPPGEGYEWVATSDGYTERRLPLKGIHYDWWRCADSSGCDDGLVSRPHGTTRSMECEIPGGAGRVGLGHCGALLGGTEDMCPPGEFGDCYGEHAQDGGWSQVLGPHNPRPGQYDPRLCVAADNQDDVGALSPPTPGHYDCWPVPGTWIYEPLCAGEVLPERGGDHCGYWQATTPTVNISGATVVEGQRATLTVETESGFNGGSGSVSFEAVAGSASAGADFRAVSGTLSFDDDGLSRQVIVETIDDAATEGPESFRVRLFGGSGVVIGTGTATVTITDNDSDTCPAGHTGSPPNCVLVPSGCAAADTRLASLRVTGGSELLAGFTPATTSYSVTVDGLSVRVTATAASSSALVRVGRSTAGTGSAARTVYLSQGSTVDVDVVVSSGGESCTYTLSVSRPSAPVTDCPAGSGQQLVDGRCVEACPGADLLPQFDSEGQVTGCLLVGDCPYDEHNQRRPRPGQTVIYQAKWLDGTAKSAAVAENETASVTRRALKCSNVWRTQPSVTSNVCLWDEVNLRSTGHCLSFVLGVEAVVPAVEADPAFRYWSFESRDCGHNRAAPRVATWTPEDAKCRSDDGQWRRSGPTVFGSSTPPTADTGQWTVALGDLSAPGGRLTSPYVNVPLEVTVTDWGDASHLVITATVIGLTPKWYFNSVTDHGFDVVWSGGDRTTVSVPRRSGPAPSDDVIEVSIAELDDLPVTGGWLFGRYRTNNQQRVEILRSQLLANDACPIGTDCADPNQWPMQIVGDAARRCDYAGPASTSMLETSQGVVGCDELDEILDPPDPGDPPSVLYWPRLWAAGADTFAYRTYGGDATVTVRFTDTRPAPLPAVVHANGGQRLRAARFDRTYSEYLCRRYRPGWRGYPTCAERGWLYTFTRDDDSIADVLYHSDVVALPEPADADGDYAGMRLRPATPSSDVEGRYGLRADMLSSRPPGTDFFTENYDAAVGDGSTLGTHCLRYSSVYCARPTSRALGGRYCDYDVYGRCNVWEPLDDTRTRRLGYIRTHSGSCEAGVAFTRWSHPASGIDRYIPVDGQADCTGALPVFACETDLALNELCYSLARAVDTGVAVVVPYAACDERYLHFLDEPAAAGAAGRSLDDYCAPGTVTLLLGDCTWDPTDADRAALAATVGWHSFLEALPQGPPGEPWPPHPEVPGGDRHIVVAHSPVWPRIASADALDVDNGAGCVWSGQWLRATMAQMLPWVPAHRAAVEAHGGLTQWLGMWDRLGADQQAEARALHTDGDLTSVACPVAAAADGTQPADQNLSYRQCRWELARPGVWHWTLDAAFTHGTRTVTETLAEDITWFRSFDAYTKQQTFTGAG